MLDRMYEEYKQQRQRGIYNNDDEYYGKQNQAAPYNRGYY